VSGPSLAVPGSIGYVVCPDALTPIELATRTPEPDIPLPISGSPAPGDFAVTTSADGRWAYVVTTDGAPTSSSTGSSSPVTTGGAPSSSTTPAGASQQDVVIPVDLVRQVAGTPIVLPGTGPTHGIVALPGGTTVLAASGQTVVPVNVVTRKVGTPIDLGASHTVYGMALSPSGNLLYVLVAGGVIPVNTVNSSAGTPVQTGLAVSSVYSPHGIVVSPDGGTVYVIGQGGSDYGGRVLPLSATTGLAGPAASFDKFGIASPAAAVVTPDGSSLEVVDSANNWINPLPVDSFASPPPPVRLPEGVAGGTEHPTDIALGPDGSTAYLVEGFDSVLPYTLATQAFGKPIPVCDGASSMAVAPSPTGGAGS
jgi:DNA-binding beta-propeller fold protein YncE